MLRFVLHLALMGAVVAPMADEAFPQTLQKPAAVEVLDGLDPVMLVKGQDVFGKTELTITRGRYTYHFSSPETRSEFEKNPAAYEVQQGGLCARMGGATGSNPNLYAVHEGRIYLFGSEECRKLFVATPVKYIPRPAAALPSAPEAATRGSALIAKAVDAVGGAAKVDSLTTYVEKGTTTIATGMGEQTVTVVVSRRMPDEVRTDRTMTREGKTMTSSIVFTKTDVFFAGPGGRVFPMAEEGRPNMATEYARHPLMLLRARKDPQFKAAAIGPDKPGGSVELVGVRLRDVAATLGIDTNTGRIVYLTYVDRDPQGRYADITVRYWDFRDAGGMTLPFTLAATTDGTPEPALSRSLTAIDVNAPLDAAMFARPVQASQP